MCWCVCALAATAFHAQPVSSVNKTNTHVSVCMCCFLKSHSLGSVWSCLVHPPAAAPEGCQPEALKGAPPTTPAPNPKASEARPGDDTTLLCPVVAFVSFAAQLGFKAALHVAVFAGG